MQKAAERAIDNHDTSFSSDKLNDATIRPKTVFEAILRSPLPAHEKSLTRLDHDGFTAIFGGGDPAARTLTNCTYYLLTHPAILRHLQDELDAAMPDAWTWPSMQTIDELP